MTNFRPLPMVKRCRIIQQFFNAVFFKIFSIMEAYMWMNFIDWDEIEIFTGDDDEMDHLVDYGGC